MAWGSTLGLCRRRWRRGGSCVWTNWSVKLLCVRETLGKIVGTLILQVVVRIEGLQPLRQLITGLVLGIVHRNRRGPSALLGPFARLGAQRAA